MIVVDASLVANAVADDMEDGARARARLIEGQDLHAPHLLDIEVLSVLRRLSTAGVIPEKRVRLALMYLDLLAIKRHPHLLFTQRIWDLRHNLTVYDAAYVALAEALGCVFVTTDKGLARAPGLGCEIESI